MLKFTCHRVNKAIEACSPTLPCMFLKLFLKLLFVMCCRLSDKNPINADDELLELLS